VIVMRVAQIAQHADDLDRASDWYAAFLGRQPAGRFDPPGLVFFMLDGARLLLEQGASSAVVYFEVDDVRTRIEQLRAEDVRVTTEPHVIFEHADDTLGPAGTAEWMAFVEDSEGNSVGLVSHDPR
jgi:methylmalonyl-CoA/ethylmalonyl-CoA epimerase